MTDHPFERNRSYTLEEILNEPIIDTLGYPAFKVDAKTWMTCRDVDLHNPVLLRTRWAFVCMTHEEILVFQAVLRDKLKVLRHINVNKKRGR